MKNLKLKRFKYNLPKVKGDGLYLTRESEKRLISRLNRIQGHIEGIKKMVSERKCADDILIQIAAVKSALNSFITEILDSELKACVLSCMEGDEFERLSKITRVLKTLLKHS